MFTFESKAKTLQYLFETKFPIPKPLSISLADWMSEPDNVIKKISTCYSESQLVVRSSKFGEDSEGNSQAGVFESILNVENKPEQIKQSINKVISSYGELSSLDEVLIQPMLLSVEISGVVMTQSPEDGSPYYVINYDDETGKTDTVTGGKTSRTVFVYRNAEENNFDSLRIWTIVELVRKLEDHLIRDDLDIEFALDKNNNAYILQVRPITTAKNWNPKLHKQVSKYLPRVSELIQLFQQRHPSLLGSYTLFGVMPDWNPAEIIGLHPRPLDVSLYRYLITQRTWAVARQEMGYYKFNPTELMIVIGGRPYIDVRSSLNSFLPNFLSPTLGEKMINLWLDRLKTHPEFHDKVEFEVASTVWNFDVEETINRRFDQKINKQEIREFAEKSFAQVKDLVSCGENSTLIKSISKLKNLEIKQEDFEKLKNPYAVLSQVKRVLDECNELGTIPFSIIARHGFIAEDWLRSLVRLSILTSNRVDQLRASIKTVSTEMSSEVIKLKKGEVDSKTFNKKYGHLRPGTYDIRSPRYDQRNIISDNSNDITQLKYHEFKWSESEAILLNQLFESKGLNIDAQEFLSYVKLSIEWREKGKFIFTRSLSFAIEGICQWGESFELSRDDLSWVNIDELFTQLAQPNFENINDYLNQRITLEKDNWESGIGLKFGYIIRDSRDVFVVPQHRSAPNFITHLKVSGELVFLKSTSSDGIELGGKVVAIESADPGYDWLFSQNISGLITQFGGTNSHMAIRCREYNIPAAIGVGEALFSKIVRFKTVSLDSKMNVIKEGYAF